MSSRLALPDRLSFQIPACLIVLPSSPHCPKSKPQTRARPSKPLIAPQQQKHNHCPQQRIRNASVPSTTTPCALTVKPTPMPAPRSVTALPSGTSARARNPSPRIHASVHLSICRCVATGRCMRTSVRHVASGRSLLPPDSVPSCPRRHKWGARGFTYFGIFLVP